MPSMKMCKHDQLLRWILTVLILLGLAGPKQEALCKVTFGVNYGKVANNLPAPAEAVTLIRSIPFTKAKLYDPDPLVLKTFRNTDVSFLVGVRNEDLESLAGTAGAATAWVTANVMAYYPSTDITGIVVGNEIYGGGDAGLISYVLPAMKNIYTALTAVKLQRKIRVSTTHSFAVLSSSYPPSSGAFVESIVDSFVRPILQFLASTDAPFMINAYPFFAYKDNPGEVSLAYVLLESGAAGTPDAATGLVYYNMFDAQLDAVYSAIAALGFKNVSICVSETGWPSAGDANEAGATLANAQAYHNNLFRHLEGGRGTPLMPNASMEVYLFALFNEDEKTGPSSERHYGLFKPDGSKAYSFNLSVSSSPAEHHGTLWAVTLWVFLCAWLSSSIKL